MNTCVEDSRLTRNTLGYLEVIDKPSPEELQQYYAQQYYQEERSSYRKTYSADELTFITHKIEQKHYLVERSALGGDRQSLLDVGCGEGFSLKWFSQKGYDVKGLDFSSAGIDAMNPEYSQYVETGDVFLSLEQKITAAESYDIIWLQHVLEHVLEPLDLLKSLRSLINPQGALLVTVPNDGNDLQESIYHSGKVDNRYWIVQPDHISYFTASSLVNTVNAAGWRCLDLITDFPIDLYLLHEGSNYISNRDNGPAAHQARISMELMIASMGVVKATDYFRASAAVGIGRSLTALVTPDL